MPDTPTSSSQPDRWSQACQAIFAGFVAVAVDHDLRPNITDFWKTPQKDMILPTLKHISCSDQDQKNERQRLEGMELDGRVYMSMLKDVLLREDNKYTQPVPDSSTAPRPDGDGDETKANEGLAVEWELTRRGQALFGQKRDEPGKRDEGFSPGGSIPKWWDM